MGGSNSKPDQAQLYATYKIVRKITAFYTYDPAAQKYLRTIAQQLIAKQNVGPKSAVTIADCVRDLAFADCSAL